MKKDNRIIPVGLKGNQINERMKELMGITSINENVSTSNVELTKVGPDGNAYAIVRENHNYFIKSTNKKQNLVKEDFKYIGGYMNRVAYPSYEKAIKHLNLKFNSLAESLDAGHNINVFENDNLLNENGFAGGFANHPKGGGFSGEGNLHGNTPLYTEESEVNEIGSMSNYEGNRGENNDNYGDTDYDSILEKYNLWLQVGGLRNVHALAGGVYKKHSIVKISGYIHSWDSDNEYPIIEFNDGSYTIPTRTGSLKFNEFIDVIKQILFWEKNDNERKDAFNFEGMKWKSSRDQNTYLDPNKYYSDDVELTETEQAIEDMGKDEMPSNESDPNEQPGSITEHKLSIKRALEQMDTIIDTLSEGKVKKKVYTIK